MFVYLRVDTSLKCPQLVKGRLNPKKQTNKTWKIFIRHQSQDSSLKIYVLKFQIGINDTFRVIRISVKAVFSIFSEVFRAYLPIQWDFWDSKNSFGNISSTSIRIYNVLSWKKYFSILKITFSFKINPKIGIFSRFLVNNIFTMKNVLNFIFSFNRKWKGFFKTVSVF